LQRKKRNPTINKHPEENNQDKKIPHQEKEDFFKHRNKIVFARSQILIWERDKGVREQYPAHHRESISCLKTPK
jgi:hypothetical protein